MCTDGYVHDAVLMQVTTGDADPVDLTVIEAEHAADRVDEDLLAIRDVESSRVRWMQGDADIESIAAGEDR